MIGTRFEWCDGMLTVNGLNGERITQVAVPIFSDAHALMEAIITIGRQERQAARAALFAQLDALKP